MDIMNYSSSLEVEENFLSEKDFNLLKETINSLHFPWLYRSTVADKNDNALGHYYYLHHLGTDTAFYDFMLPIYAKLNIDMTNHNILRARVNHYPRTEKIIKHGLHRDQEYHIKTVLLFLNTCDGYTYFKEPNQKVYSIENTAVHFDSFFMHHSTTATNVNRRVTLQVSYV